MSVKAIDGTMLRTLEMLNLIDRIDPEATVTVTHEQGCYSFELSELLLLLEQRTTEPLLG